MPYINVDEAYILDNTGLQVDQVVDIPYADAGLTETQQAQARKNIVAGGTNPNLLDNSFFTINQRVFSSATATTANTYCVDRWILFAGGAGAGTLTKNADGTLTINNSSGTTNMYMRQPLLDLGLTGKTVTISAMTSDGTVYHATGVVPAQNTSYQGVAVATITSTCEVGFTVAPTTLSYPYFVQISSNAGANVTLKAVKLELGTVSTLANDVPPDYGTELAKCQRYFNRISFGSTNYPIAYGYAYSATAIRYLIPLPVTMRTTPTLALTNSFLALGTNAGTNAVTAFTPVATFPNGVLVLGTTSNHTIGISILMTGANATLDLSADL